jgi:hypothetical protein
MQGAFSIHHAAFRPFRFTKPGSLLLDSLMWPLTVAERDVLRENSLDLSPAISRQLSSASFLNDPKKHSMILFMFGTSTPLLADIRWYAR